MNDTTELMDNWDNFEEPILEIDFEENVVADQGRPHSHSSLFLPNPHLRKSQIRKFAGLNLLDLRTF
jgi:hypothetical protein